MKEFKSRLKKYGITSEPTDFPRVKITESRDINEYVRNFFFDDIDVFESFFMVTLNNSNNTVGFTKISQGGITGTVVDIRIVAKYALESLATSVILCHNHPSGTLKPSEQDKRLTEKIIKGLELLDIKVLDHIIIVNEDNRYFSFADEGIL